MYDYVIIGAGSAGCVLAARLSEDPEVRVALIEAGPPDSVEEIHIPAAFGKLMQTSWDWAYLSEPEPGLDERRKYLPRGRMLGGCSSANAMIYIRGNAADYDEWRALGAVGWGWEDVLPYFLRAEDNERGASAWHATGGPLRVSDGRSQHPIMQAWVAAAEQAGHPRTDDFNGPAQEGVGFYQLTQRDGRRWSTADAYLRPALSRPNLWVITDAVATRLLFHGDRTVGVEVERGGARSELRADREVLLSAGAYNSPQLLMLSGIGPADALARLGIAPRIDLPVGENLQDHVHVPLAYRTGTPTLRTAESAENLELFTREGRGPLTSNIGEAGGFFRSQDDLSAPDFQVHATPVAFFDDGLAPADEDAFIAGACLLRPTSRGRVSLRSALPTAKPRILHNYLTATEDLATMVRAVRTLLDIAGQPALAPHRGEPLRAPASDREADIIHHIRRTAHTLYHPAGTCAIGPVVDAELRVHGVAGLRVVDASVMPTVVRGNTNAPTIMIAEKAADLVRGRAPAQVATHALPA